MLSYISIHVETFPSFLYMSVFVISDWHQKICSLRLHLKFEISGVDCTTLMRFLASERISENLALE